MERGLRQTLAPAGVHVVQTPSGPIKVADD